jgi:hypothetical protein
MQIENLSLNHWNKCYCFQMNDSDVFMLPDNFGTNFHHLCIIISLCTTVNFRGIVNSVKVNCQQKVSIQIQMYCRSNLFLAFLAITLTKDSLQRTMQYFSYVHIIRCLGLAFLSLETLWNYRYLPIWHFFLLRWQKCCAKLIYAIFW